MYLPDGSGFWEWPDGTPIIWGSYEDDMTYSLFDLTYKVARELGIVHEGTATGGTTGTLIDTYDLNQANDLWIDGSIWVLYDAGGAGAAPQGQFAIASGSTASTSTVTFRSALTAAVASGDRYAICRKIADKAWLNVIIQKINTALQDLDRIPWTDVTSITVAANQTEYSLPIAANMDLREVWLQAINTDANDNQWTEVRNWTVAKADPGNADTLILPYQHTAGYALKLVYHARHPDLYVYSSPLSENVPIERVINPAVRDCFMFRKANAGGANTWDDEISIWTQRAEEVKSTRPIRAVFKKGRIGDFSNNNTRYYPGDRTLT